jgi:hypothetical protein
MVHAQKSQRQTKRQRQKEGRNPNRQVNARDLLVFALTDAH